MPVWTRSPKKILLIKLRALGDTVLLTTVIHQLRAACPDAQIDLMIMSAWAELYEGFPGVGKIWAYERHEDTAARAKSVARLAIKLQPEKYDVVLNFHASPSSSILALATRAPIRAVHFHGHRDKNRYSTVEITGKGKVKPIIERDMDVVRALGITVPEGLLPAYKLQTMDVEQGRHKLESYGVEPIGILGLGLGASRPSKSWPLSRFAELAIKWCQAKPQDSAVIGFVGPLEAHMGQEFLKQVDEILASKMSDQKIRTQIRAKIFCEVGLPLKTLASILSLCELFVGNDSGPKHLAVSVGTPTLTLFGPEDPFEWHPYPRKKHDYFYVAGLACRRDAEAGMPPWCSVTHCLHEGQKCMTLTSVDSVFTKCLELAGQ